MSVRATTLPAALLVLVLALGVGACGGSEIRAGGAPTGVTAAATPSPAPSPSSTPTPSPTPTPEGDPRPLNGLPLDAPVAMDRRVVAVKIDNHAAARPQSGIDQADAVYELVVEAGLTRFIALFHTADPVHVGPMRSGRPTDPTLIRPSGSVFAISGAQDWVLTRIRNAGVHVIGEVGPPQTRRSASRPAPHDLYVDVAALRDLADDRGYDDTPPVPLFDFRPWEPDAGAPARQVDIAWSKTTSVTWTHDGASYVRAQDGVPHRTVDPDGATAPIRADTLVVIEAPFYTARPDGPGTPVPATDTVGQGTARVFHAGRVVEGSWERASAAEVFTLTTETGDTLWVPPGRPWISVVPAGRAVTY